MVAPGEANLRRSSRSLAIVPARLASTRLPRKMMLRDTGRYLFEHTVRNVERCPRIERVVLAADDPELIAAGEEVGVRTVATSPDHPSGTDRVREAHETLRGEGEGPWDVIVNVQGDEPELPTDHLASLISAFDDPAVEMATLSAPLEEASEADDPAVVKVACSADGDALYFSRSPIPSTARSEAPDAWRQLRRHIGAYAFRPAALETFCALPRGVLEQAESLEQLRWLEAGHRLRVIEVDRVTGGIDTPDQYAAFVQRLARASA